MKNYRNLQVWAKSHELTLGIYKLVAGFPHEETFGLAGQMRRSAASIPTNIAEGCGRQSDKEFCRFLHMSFGSANELEYQVILSADLLYLNRAECDELLFQIAEIKKMLYGLICRLKDK